MSIYGKMAWRNIWRNPRRTVLTISAIAFACLLLVFMLSWQFGSYSTMINASLQIQTGHLQVMAEKYNKKLDMRRVTPDPSAVAKILGNIGGIETFTYRAEGFSLASSEDRTYGVLATGIDPEKEARVSTIETIIRKGEYLSPGDTNQALVGALLARNLQVGLGDEITVLGQGRDGSIAAAVLIVKGVFRSGVDDFDRNAIYMPLDYFQEIYSMRGAVHRIVAVCESLKAVPQAKKEIQDAVGRLKSTYPITVLDWKELMPGLVESISLDLTMGIIFYLILVIVVAFSILNTFLMAIMERTKEFGVMLAIGVTPGRLTQLVLVESAFMTGVGVVIGIVMGCIVTLIVQQYGIDISGASELLSEFGISGRIYPKLSWLSALSGPSIVLAITFFTASYPALKVRKLSPVEALAYV